LPFLVNFGLIDMRDFLQSIGKTLAEVESAQDFNTPIQAYIRAAGDRFLELMRQRIDEKNANSNFMLREGLKFDENIRTSDGYKLDFYSEEDYALFRDQGVSGTETKRDTEYSFKNNYVPSAMAESIEDWMNNKGFSGISRSYAYATSVLLKKKGFDGIHFIDAAFNDSNLDAMNSQLAQIMENSAIGIIETIIPEFR
jgi:hypothetical protein